MVANTFIPGSPEEKATFVEAGCTYLGNVSETGYNMLDLFLCDSVTLGRCLSLCSVRDAALATDHFLVKAVFEFDSPPTAAKQSQRPNLSALSKEPHRSNFARSFCAAVHTDASTTGTVSSMWADTRDAMKIALETLPPKGRETINHPWISEATLALIGQRRLARSQNRCEDERRLHKDVRKSAKLDRTRWLDQLLQDGDWQQIRKIRNPRRARSAKLRDSAGEIVESDQWADTMADHFEKVQWCVRPAGLVDGPPLGNELPVLLSRFTADEVDRVIQKLKRNRASGPDDVPAEFWQAVSETSEGLAWVTALCNRCWTDEQMPDDWHQANVNAIHKKGAVDNCGNYRPISLICVAYKLFASLLLKRLQAAGAEDRLTSTQFGFRRGHGTGDAICAVRRHIDLALAQRFGRTAMLALDWAKAFDSINVGAMITALRRFGLPEKVLRIIGHIYEDRLFSVTNGGTCSSTRRQCSGISQGCPLSPFLFVMLMSVMMKDAVGTLCPESQALYGKGSLDSLLYADDTLIVGVAEERVQELLDAVATTGLKYGMELHWSKFQLLQVNGTYKLSAPDGSVIEPTDVMTYLGACIYSDGGVKSELNRRLGAGWSDFCKLSRLWKHTTLSRARKLQILQAVISSRLLYSLGSAWLNVAELRRLNGFQCRCLRPILGIKPSFISRVSNSTVLQQSGQIPYGRQLLRQQLLLFGRVARAPPTHPLRKLTFVPGSLSPATGHYVRRVGRPRNEWAVMLEKEARKVHANFNVIIRTEPEWKAAVYGYCMSTL